MTLTKRFVWAGVIAACGGLAQAQTTGTTTTTTPTTTGGNGGGTVGGTTTSSGNDSPIVVQQAESPTITSTTDGGVTRSTAIATSNGLGAYYANPLYQGRAGAQTGGLTAVNPAGGFGAALYGTTGVSGAAGAGSTGGARGTGANTATTGTAGRTGGTGATTSLGGVSGTGTTGAAGRTGTTGAFGGVAATGTGATGRTGAGGTTGTNNQNSALSTGRQISYTQTLRIPGVAPIAPVQLQSDLQSMISSSSVISNTGGVQVSAGEGGVVLIRGRVADDDEARMVEGMIRLTPGVKDVKNELTTK